MKNVLRSLTLTTVLLFAVSAIAADKVVVVPLGGKKSTGDAIAADVLEGKTFSNKDDTDIVGTLPTQTFDPASTNVPAGYYNATTLNGVDSDLATGNIKDGITIFGVVGTHPLAGVEKTGQTPTAPLNPAPTGSDGALQKGAPWPNPRFTDNADGTVTDNLTGIIWLKNANCFGTRTWATALTDSNSLASGACGLIDGSVAGDWRLSNVKELQSLIDFGTFNPALPSGHPFSGVVLDAYWSSSTSTVGSGYALYVYVSYGYVNGTLKTNSNYVWPVRGGQ